MTVLWVVTNVSLLVNMDRNAPDNYIERTEQSIKETEEFIQWVKARGNPMIEAVVTPRFVPSCSEELMKALGKLAQQYNVPIQSHISENPSEVEWIHELHPECASYADVSKPRGCLVLHVQLLV